MTVTNQNRYIGQLSPRKKFIRDVYTPPQEVAQG